VLHQGTPVREDDDAAARAALVVCKGTAPEYDGGSRLDRFRIAPDAAILTEDEIVARLGTFPKPVVCESSLLQGIVEIRCEAVTGDYEYDLRHQRSQVHDGTLFSHEERERMAEIQHGKVLVIGGGDVLLVDVQDYERMWWEYVFTGFFCIPRDPAPWGDSDQPVIAAREFAPCTSPTTVQLTRG
jgi:hypothetical protein